jgi:DNA-binding response OmpR family regulator
MNRSRHATVTGSPGGARTVLIVDDEAPVRESLRRYLKAVGYAVMEAADFDQAVRTLGATSVNAVVLDVRLPGRSGLDLLEYLRSDSKLAALPVLILTGYFPDTTDQALLKKLSASIFYKPLGCVTVLRHLERMMER